MKKLFILSITLFFTTISYSQDCGNAEVRKIQGYDIYIFAEPTAAYEICYDLSPGGNMFLSQLDDWAKMFIKRANKKNDKSEKKGWKKAEAIIIYDSDSGAGIRYIKEDEKEKEDKE